MYYAMLIGGPRHGSNVKLESLPKLLTMADRDESRQPDYLNITYTVMSNYELRGVWANPEEQDLPGSVDKIHLYHYIGKH